MEIKDILKELIAASNAELISGHPENFDLEDFVAVMKSYYRELDEIGEFYYESDDDFDSDEYENDNY